MTAGCMDYLLHMADLSFFPLDPWDLKAGQAKNTQKKERNLTTTKNRKPNKKPTLPDTLLTH